MYVGNIFWMLYLNISLITNSYIMSNMVVFKENKKDLFIVYISSLFWPLFIFYAIGYKFYCKIKYNAK